MYDPSIVFADSPMLRCIESEFPQVVCMMQYDVRAFTHTVLVLDRNTNSKIFSRRYTLYDISDADVFDEITYAIKKYYSVATAEDIEKEPKEKHAHYCESCGAPLQKGAAVCVYCGTEIY